MDWISLLGLIFGGAGFAGSIGAVIYFKPRLKGERLEARKKDVEVSDSAMDLVVKLEERLNSKSDTITKLENQVYLSGVKEREHGWIISEHERKLEGMQRTIRKEIERRKFAERFICFVEDCKLRRPPLGTYKKEA